MPIDNLYRLYFYPKIIFFSYSVKLGKKINMPKENRTPGEKKIYTLQVFE